MFTGLSFFSFAEMLHYPEMHEREMRCFSSHVMEVKILVLQVFVDHLEIPSSGFIYYRLHFFSLKCLTHKIGEGEGGVCD